MKKNFGIFFLFMVLALNSVMGQEENKQIYKDKIYTYTKMHNMGLALTGFGGGSLLAGSILLGTLPDCYWDQSAANVNPDQKKYDQQAVQSMVFLSLGMGLLAGGLTMSHIAKKKVRSLSKQLNNVSLGVVKVPGGHAISLVYHF
jgi:hypothetical protein